MGIVGSGRALYIRPYVTADFNACCDIFKSNVPKFFARTEYQDYQRFLKEYAGSNYWVMGKGPIIGAGGIRIMSGDHGALSYGLLHSDQHGKGYGSLLYAFRMERLLAVPSIKTVQIDTTQHVEGFFRKFGFVTEKIAEDYYGEGLHRYDMVLEVKDRERLLERFADCLKTL